MLSAAVEQRRSQPKLDRFFGAEHDVPETVADSAGGGRSAQPMRQADELELGAAAHTEMLEGRGGEENSDVVPGSDAAAPPPSFGDMVGEMGFDRAAIEKAAQWIDAFEDLMNGGDKSDADRGGGATEMREQQTATTTTKADKELMGAMLGVGAFVVGGVALAALALGGNTPRRSKRRS